MIEDLRRLGRSSGLVGKSVRGAGSLAAGTFAEYGLRFLRNVILARFLVPESFGLIAMVLAATAVAEAFTEVGLRQSIIQNKKGGEKAFLEAAWVISVLRGLSLYLLAYFFAPLVAAFYHRQEMIGMLRVGFLAIALNGCMSTRVHVLEKQFIFKKWVILMQGSGAFAVLFTIIAGIYFRNAWTLVVGYVGESLLRSFLSFIICPLRPSFRIKREFATEILRFSRGMFGLPILMMLFSQTDIFVIGRVLSLAQLGMYSLAKGLAEIPNAVAAKMVYPVILPAFSVMQDDKDKLRTTLITVNKLTAILAIPLCAFMIVCAEDILAVAFGGAYIAAAMPFCLLCLNILVFILSSLIMVVYFAIGTPGVHRKAASVRTVVLLVLIYPSVRFCGMSGGALAVLCAMLTSLGVQLIYIRKTISLGILVYLKSLLPGLGLSAIVLLPSLGAKFVSARGLLHIVIAFALCAFSWAAGIGAFWKPLRRGAVGS